MKNVVRSKNSTSNDTIISSSPIVWARMNSENSLEFLQFCLLSSVLRL